METSIDEYPKWKMNTTININDKEQARKIEYKYIIKAPNMNTIWESGDNRKIDLLPNIKLRDNMLILHDKTFGGGTTDPPEIEVLEPYTGLSEHMRPKKNEGNISSRVNQLFRKEVMDHQWP